MEMREKQQNKKDYFALIQAGIPRQRTLFSTRTTLFQPRQPTADPKILSVLIQLEKEGKSDYTIRNVDKFLERINRKSRTRQLSNESNIAVV